MKKKQRLILEEALHSLRVEFRIEREATELRLTRLSSDLSLLKQKQDALGRLLLHEDVDFWPRVSAAAVMEDPSL